MPLTLVSEAMPRRPAPASSRQRPYTPEEDATIRAMLAAGCHYNQIAAALGRPRHGIRYRASVVSNIRPGCGPGNTSVIGRDHCHRCGVLLAVAPAASSRDGLCGWCAGGK